MHVWHVNRAREGPNHSALCRVNLQICPYHCVQLACSRFLACSRVKLWWMIPCHGSRGGEVPPETQFLLLELGTGGPYAVLLPLIHKGSFRATLRPGRCRC